MHCTSCGQENRDTAKYCANCGRRLAAVCSACGAELPSGARFCDACGEAVQESASHQGRRSTPPPPAPSPRSYTPKHLAEKILTSRAALEGERKQVTVLFADVKGSMDLAEQVDPEDWHRIMDGFFTILADGIHRFEGTINQYTGDGIMALFGAPLAHEDHAQRACYAALHLRDELRAYAEHLRRTQSLNFSVRMGLNAGEVVVGKIGDDLRMDYTAQGHTVGLAARMEQLAEAGTAYLTGEVANQVQGFFTLRDLGRFTLKGVREPVPVYALEGLGPLRTRLDLARVRGLSRFVGRERETAALEAALARAIHGEGCIIGIVAEPGVGKSRLCFEFAERCRARGIEVTSAFGVPHGKWIPFHPILDMLRDFCGVTDSDTGEEARRKVAGTLLLRGEAFKQDLPLLFEFLGIADAQLPVPRMDPEARQRGLFALVQRLIQTRTQGGPALLLFDDLHWIDAASDAALANLVEVVPSTSTLVVLNFRPEYHADWMQRPWYTLLPLEPLGDAETAELLRDLLGSDPPLVDLAGRIRERTGGNPFFIEEVVQSLLDHGVLVRDGAAGRGRLHITQPVDEIQIPSSVQAVLAARIDRLPDGAKAVLHTAAVIGKQFTGPVLNHVITVERAAPLSASDVAGAVDVLLTAEFIREQALYPEAEYAFRHPLTQEVAYRSQLGEHRTKVHAAVARTLAALYPAKLDQHAAFIADHWEGAGEVLEAARWTRRAAEWVGYRDAIEAQRRWRKLRALTEAAAPSDETRALEITACIQILTLGFRMGMSQEEAATVFQTGRTLAERAGDVRALTRLHNNYGVVCGMAGETEKAVRHLTEAARLAEQTGDTGLRLGMRLTTAIWHLHVGQLRQASVAIDEAFALADGDPKAGAELIGFSPYVFLVLYRGALCVTMGDLAEAAVHLTDAIRLAEEHQEVELLGMAHGFHALLARYRGDPGGALEHAEQAIAIAERIGSTLSRGQAFGMLGTAHVSRGEWTAAIDVFHQELRITRERRTGLLMEAGSLAVLAEAYLGAGDLTQARATAEEALALALQRHSRVLECDARIVLARALLHSEGLASRSAVEAGLARAVELTDETGAKSREPFIHLARAELAALSGDTEARKLALETAQRLFVVMGAAGHAEKTAAQLAAVRHGR